MRTVALLCSHARTDAVTSDDAVRTVQTFVRTGCRWRP
jgi:hypothetical protein